jgi:hypothetical protein
LGDLFSAFDIQINDDNFGPHAGSHIGSMGARDSGANDHHCGGFNTGNAAQEDTSSAKARL